MVQTGVPIMAGGAGGCINSHVDECCEVGRACWLSILSHRWWEMGTLE
jgi:hypothetical protein